MEEQAKLILEDALIIDMLFNARLNFAIEEEVAFVIAVAHLDGLLSARKKFNKYLNQILCYPLDDIAVALRIFEMSQKISSKRFRNFAIIYGIDIVRFNKAKKLKEHLMKVHSRYCRGIRPQCFTTIIDAVSNLMVKYLLHNPAVFVGNNYTFFDYNKQEFFKISPTSRLSYSLGTTLVRATVYYKINKRFFKGANKSFVSFVCIVPVQMTTDLKYWKIINGKFIVGQLIAKRILQINEKFNKNTNDSDYVLFQNYNLNTGELLALCTNNSIKKVQTIIQNEIKKTAKELNEIEHRHFFLKHYSVWVVIGLGLSIVQLYLTNSDYDSLSIAPSDNRELTKLEIKNISRQIRQINPRVTFSIFEENNSHRILLIATFPTVAEAYSAKKTILNRKFSNLLIRFHNYKKHDFFGRQQNQIYYSNIKILERSNCGICLATPDRENFIRLTLCDHLYCSDCLIDMIKFSDKFPINCVTDNCSGSLTFRDVDIILKHMNFKTLDEMYTFLEPIIKKSFEYFLRTKNHCYKKCMTKNCNRILNVSLTLKKLYKEEFKENVCKLSSLQRECLIKNPVYCYGCKLECCGICGYSFHPKTDCQEFYALNFVYNDKTLVLWKSDDPNSRRFCPNPECHILLEKAEGCNHMQCSMCKIHFCWLCKDYQTNESSSIYNHIQVFHGGDGLQLNFLEELFE